MGIKTRLFEKGFTADLWLHTGSFLLLLATFPFMLQSLLFMPGLPLDGWLFPAIFIALSSYYGWFLFRKKVPAAIVLVWFVIVLVLLVLTEQICEHVYDFSYDGMWYHQDAVRLMVEGWNPYHHFLSIEETGRSDLFVNHYPKAVWTSEAAVYAFTHKLESAKMINWLFWYASICLSVYTLRKVCAFNWFLTLLSAAVIACNPVVLYQLFSFYVDGVLANLILCLFLLVILHRSGNLSPGSFLLLLASTAIFLMNTKFTGLVYAGVFGAVYIVYEWVLQKKEGMKSMLRVGGIVALGVLVFGYPAYVNNTLTKGHPLYPLMGEGNVGESIMNVPLPANFKDKNRFEQFNMAMFAKPVWSRNPESSKPRELFTYEGVVHYDEYKRADPEMGGFGPMFGEVLYVLAGGIVWLLLWNRKLFTLPVCMGMIALLLSIVVMPAFWYARYAPQTWMLVCFLVLLFLRARYTAGLSYGVLLILLLNSYMVADQNWSTQLIRTRELNAFFSTLQSQPERPLVFDGWTGPFKIKLKENNIRYTPVQKAYPEDSIVYFPNAWMCGAYAVKQH
jgi:hypothetical protein